MSNYVNLCKQHPSVNLLSTGPKVFTGNTHSIIQQLMATITLWRQRSRQRQQLANLSTQQLRDIGISADQADREASKPFWMS